jgi:hypothetical protein
MSKQVVARFQDGRLLKGTSLDVGPDRPTFHIRPLAGPVMEVRLRDLKALYFVRSLDGNPDRRDRKSADPLDPRARGSRVVGMQFADGEFLVGLTIACPPKRPYFFALPVDPKSNNIRILVNRDAVVSMTPLQIEKRALAAALPQQLHGLAQTASRDPRTAAIRRSRDSRRS